MKRGERVGAKIAAETILLGRIRDRDRITILSISSFRGIGPLRLLHTTLRSENLRTEAHPKQSTTGKIFVLNNIESLISAISSRSHG